MAINIGLDKKILQQETCRTCSRYYTDGTMEFFRIFEEQRYTRPENNENVDEIDVPSADINEIYEELIIWKLNIKRNDGLPQQICQDCFDRFRSVKLFREECVDSQEVLVSYFKNELTSEQKSNVGSPRAQSVLSGECPLSPSFNTDDLIEEVSETSIDSPVRSLHQDDDRSFNPNSVYQESTMGTPPQPLFNDILLEDISAVDLDGNQEEQPKIDDELSQERKTSVDRENFDYQWNSNDEEFSEPSSDEEESDIDCNTDNGDDNDNDENDNHKCDICFDNFDDRSTLRRHRMREHSQEPYTCDICSREFRTRFFLKQHKATHETSNIECNACSKVFRSQLHLQRHQKNFHLTSTFTCHICNQKFENYTQLRFSYHVRSHNEKRFNCSFCEKSFHQKSHCENHERVHTKEKPFVCHICGAAYRNRTTCEEHVLKHADSHPFKCEICLKGFSQSTALRLHLRIHTGVKKYLCDECGQSFIQKIQYNLHKMTHTNERPFQCKLCKKSFRLRHHLGSHIHTVHSAAVNVKIDNQCSDNNDTLPKDNNNGNTYSIRQKQDEYGNLVCRLCGCLFATRRELQMHSKVHLNVLENIQQEDRKYKCEICKTAFKRQLHLKIHMDSVHSKSRPHTCGYCGKSFALNSNLQIHLKTHQEDRKTFACQFCDKKFLTKKSLLDHDQVHSGENHFKCNFCDQTFTYRGALGQHMLGHLEADEAMNSLMASNVG